nr:hypothetical protein [uncultured Noviherbaspirillum sp.]
MPITREVLTLEIQDEAIKNLFSEVRTLFRSGKIPSVPHVTIRGPYSKHVPRTASNKVNKTLGNDADLDIVGVGRFDSSKEHVVFLKLNGEKLRQVWWKPDYPIKDHGFHPHLTVFRGSKDEADRVYDFLCNQNIGFNVKRYQLRTDVLGQKQKELDLSS